MKRTYRIKSWTIDVEGLQYYKPQVKYGFFPIWFNFGREKCISAEQAEELCDIHNRNCENLKKGTYIYKPKS